jgi:hypothetical protein
MLSSYTLVILKVKGCVDSHSLCYSIKVTVGVAPNANIFGVKSIGDAGGGTWTNIINGLVWIGDNFSGPTVVSMSIG